MMSMSIRAMIVEDERLARDELAYLLRQEKGVILCPDAKSGEELLSLQEIYQPDVIFLDIQMPGLSGIEVVRQLQKKGNVPLIVFTTAYYQHAVEAFDLEAVDYLLKPYDENRFKKAMARVRRQLNSRSTGKKRFQSGESISFTSGKLLIENGERVVVLSAEKICFAARSQRIVEIYTETDRIESKMTLLELESKLQGYPFFRCHRSYLVNLEYIQEITPWFNGAYNLILKDKKRSKIPVSRSAAKKLFQFFEGSL